ncbi:ATP-binding cassette domain-containing protein [Roseateles sp. DAIF2]|uniref:oligopeptide/dipeptide ABC transporter ATP-binding protein n=1 Tax=Roseateles sp. DAIF2 TaxID=2714952 RepID=UPI0018A2942F|nr:oligopeptide/dipeptide ABC transporter ATP-binding protein [Roseateles sp. DAIF2]QPF71834.1 ATP-binding cassette domain-containing protein [Roseateles sp. DAIF2]
MAEPTPLLELRGLSRHYRLPRERLFGPVPRMQALRDISLRLPAGRSLGIVGESGSGKSTLARAVMALDEPHQRDGGQVLLDGRDLLALAPEELRLARARLQMVFQDPYGSLDPRRQVGRIVAEPLASLTGLGAAAQRERVLETVLAVGLREADLDKYPHEFSGGQRQRIAIARAIVTRPALVVADEPVSALDVSVQAQVLNLLAELRQRFRLSYLLISHDLAVVDHVCDEILVLYRGRVVEQGSPEALFRLAAHPYTQALLDAVPQARPGARRRRPAAAAPLAAQARPGTGCDYAARCPHATPRCLAEAPGLRALGGGQQAACHHAEAILRHRVVHLEEASP